MNKRQLRKRAKNCLQIIKPCDAKVVKRNGDYRNFCKCGWDLTLIFDTKFPDEYDTYQCKCGRVYKHCGRCYQPYLSSSELSGVDVMKCVYQSDTEPNN